MRPLAIPTLMALAAVSAIACASSSGITQISDNTYMSSKLGGISTLSGSQLKADLFKEADQFCSSKGKKMESLAATHVDRGQWTQGTAAAAEIQFKCVTPSRFSSPPRK